MRLRTKDSGRERQRAAPGKVLALAGLLLMLLAGFPAFAQQAAPATAGAPALAGDTSKAAGAPAGEAGSADNTITFTARRMESIIAKGKEKTILIGGAVINTGTMEIKAERIELFGEDYNDVLCTGTVVVFDESKGFLLKSATLTYARDTEIGLAQTQVVLEDSKNDVLLKAEWVRFDQKQSLVDARIGVHILKEDFAVRAEFAHYNRNDESLQLSGTPVAVSSDGTIEADAMSGKTDMETMQLDGRVSGTITTKKKEATQP